MALSEVIKVRLSPDERYQLSMEAKAQGSTLAAIIRHRLFGPQTDKSVVQIVVQPPKDVRTEAIVVQNVRTDVVQNKEDSYRRFTQPGALLKKG